MIANMIFSVGNALPVNLLQTDPGNCGQLKLDITLLRAARSLWFGGKYMLVCIEILLVWSSIRALACGARFGPASWREVAAHAACAGVGLAAFVSFFVITERYDKEGFNENTQAEAQMNEFTHLNLDDDLDDYEPSNAAGTLDTSHCAMLGMDLAAPHSAATPVVSAQAFDSASGNFNELMAAMMRVWLGGLGLAIALWLVLRWQFVRLSSRFRAMLEEAEEQWNRDLWSEADQGERESKKKLLMMVQQGYDEIARPLVRTLGQNLRRCCP